MADFKLNYTGTEINAIINAMANLIDTIYPVGSIYISANSANPGTFFPNTTWVQIKDTFLLAAGDTYSAGSTGGEATHILTKNEMPSHFHNFFILQWWATDVERSAGGNVYSWKTSTGGSTQKMYNTSTTEQYLLDAQGGGQAHNNMPPYLTVYVWQRIE